MLICADYSQAQNEIISEIQKSGLYKGEKTCLLVLMSTNNYIRTDKDLANILSEYPGMPSREKLLNCIHDCEREGFLKKTIINNGINSQCYYYQDSECMSRYLNTLPEEIQVKINVCRTTYQDSECVTVLGLLSGGGMKGYINSSFNLRMKEARSEILLPMLNTAPNEVIIEILKERAKAGVKVKILLPDFNKVVKKIRHAKEDATQGWITQLQDIENIEIRIYSRVEDASIYSSLIVDRKICRICVFDSEREKSSNGTLIEVAKNGYNLNIVEMMINRFYEIWLNSRCIDESIFKHYIKSKNTWLLIGFFICIFLYVLTNDLIQEVVLNIAMTLGGIFIGLIYQDGVKIVTNIYKKYKTKKE